MPRVARKRRAPRYEPYDTRSRTAAPESGLMSLPAEMLAHILSFVPWRTARAVCRTFAALRPAPAGTAVYAELMRAMAKVYRHAIVGTRLALASRANDSEWHETGALVEKLDELERYPLTSVAEFVRALDTDILWVCICRHKGVLEVDAFFYGHPGWITRRLHTYHETQLPCVAAWDCTGCHLRDGSAAAPHLEPLTYGELALLHAFTRCTMSEFINDARFFAHDIAVGDDRLAPERRWTCAPAYLRQRGEARPDAYPQ